MNKMFGKKIFLLMVVCTLIVSCSTTKKPSKTPTTSANSNGTTNDSEIINVNDIKSLDSLNTKTEIAYSFLFSQFPELSLVLDEAKLTGKMVYLDIGADWCTPCKLMKRDVYTHKETADFFNENFINYMVDIEKNEGPDLKVIFEIESVPTLLWLNDKGRVIHKKEGACYQKDLIDQAKTALTK